MLYKSLYFLCYFQAEKHGWSIRVKNLSQILGLVWVSNNFHSTTTLTCSKSSMETWTIYSSEQFKVRVEVGHDFLSEMTLKEKTFILLNGIDVVFLANKRAVIVWWPYLEGEHPKPASLEC